MAAACIVPLVECLEAALEYEEAFEWSFVYQAETMPEDPQAITYADGSSAAFDLHGAANTAFAVQDGILFLDARGAGWLHASTGQKGRFFLNKDTGYTVQYRVRLIESVNTIEPPAPGNFSGASLNVNDGREDVDHFWQLGLATVDGHNHARLLAGTHSQIIRIGRDFHTFTVTVHGDTVTWYHDGRLVGREAPRTNVPGNRLRLGNLRGPDHTAQFEIDHLKIYDGGAVAPVPPEHYSAAPAHTPQIRISAGAEEFALSLDTRPGAEYDLCFTDDLNAPDWRPLRTIYGDGKSRKLIDPVAGIRKRFYRVRSDDVAQLGYEESFDWDFRYEGTAYPAPGTHAIIYGNGTTGAFDVHQPERFSMGISQNRLNLDFSRGPAALSVATGQDRFTVDPDTGYTVELRIKPNLSEAFGATVFEISPGDAFHWAALQFETGGSSGPTLRFRSGESIYLPLPEGFSTFTLTGQRQRLSLYRDGLQAAVLENIRTDINRDFMRLGHLTSADYLSNFEVDYLRVYTGGAVAPLDPDRMRLWAAGVAFNGEAVLNPDRVLLFQPGAMSTITVAPPAEYTEAQTLRARVTRWLPDGSSRVTTATVDPGDSETINLGPMTAPPRYSYQAGKVYRRGYRLEVKVEPEDGGAPLFHRHYYQGLSDTPTDWRIGEDMAAGEERLLPGNQTSVVYNPLYGVEAAIGLHLHKAVLENQDNVVVRIRLNPEAVIAKIAGELRIEDSAGDPLFRLLPLELIRGEDWQSIPVEAFQWPQGDYRITFHPIIDGELWAEGPEIEYRRRSRDENRIRVSPLAPWSLERDPERDEIVVTDFESIADSWIANGDPGNWQWTASGGGKALVYPSGSAAESLHLQPGLAGAYAVFARGLRSGCLLEVGDDPLARPLISPDVVFIAVADLDAGIYLHPFDIDPRSEDYTVESGLAELRLVPVTSESAAAFREEIASPPVPLYAVTDWADALHVPTRLDADQFDLLAGAQAELGLRSLGWSIGRSWLEYHTELPGKNLFPVVPLEEAAVASPRAREYKAREIMIHDKGCPLQTVLDGRPRHGAEIWPWLAMNRHYGANSGGGIFASEWFLNNPQWWRWRKNAGGSDNSEVSYFFEEVRRERVDILLEAAAMGADGILVGGTRQMPMILYHPAMVDAYRAETGVDPLAIDAADGSLYLDWIRWRADHFTEVLRMLRAGLEDIENQGGARIPVAVRVPSAGLFYNLAQGFDVEQWMHEGLVDRIQLNPLEDRGGRGSHDVTPYLQLGHRHGVTVTGGIGATWRNTARHPAALRRALGLLDAGVEGIEIYATEYLTRMDHRRWVLPLFGNRERLIEHLQNSNLEACHPLTGASAMAGHDNHSRWSIDGYNVHGTGGNSL